jgi:TctA family transporter
MFAMLADERSLKGLIAGSLGLLLATVATTP